MPAISDRGTAGSKPPASPLVTMQYVTSYPALVHDATVPAEPKSTSSGWAVTTRMRSMTGSSGTAVLSAARVLGQSATPGGFVETQPCYAEPRRRPAAFSVACGRHRPAGVLRPCRIAAWFSARDGPGFDELS